MFNFNSIKKRAVGWKRPEHYVKKTSKLTKEFALRSKVDFVSMLNVLPDPDEILSNTGNSITVYRSLFTDSQVRACVQSRKAGTLSLKWGLDKKNSGETSFKAVKDVFNFLDVRSITAEILNAPFFGFQVLEVIWEKRGGYILPVKVVAKNPEWFCFDNQNNLKFRTYDNWLGEDVPERKFLIASYNDACNNYYNPYGDRILSSCFWAVTFKKSTFKWWVTFTEKYGMPYLIGKLPRGRGNEEYENFKTELDNMVQDAVAIIDNEEAVEIQEAGGKQASADIYDKLIIACDDAIAKAILGQSLTTQSGGGSGSYALGKVHGGIRDDIVDSDRVMVENIYNQLIRWIYEINFSDADLPVFRFHKEDEIDKTLAERDKILCESGLRFTKEYYKKVYGFEDEDIALVG